MTITAYAQWDGTTAANNVDLNDIPLVENNMYPRHVNNAFREMMKQLKASTGLGGVWSTFTQASSSGSATFDLLEDTDNGTNYGRFTVVASLTANRTYTFPNFDIAGWREVLTANRTYYVRTDGSDSNTGLVDSAGGAFLTVQKALNIAFGTLDLAGFDVTIQVGAGTYTGQAAQTSPQVGAGTISIVGDTTTPSNVVFSTTSADAVAVSGLGVSLRCRGVKVQTATSGVGFRSQFGARLLLDGLFETGACATAHMQADNTGHIRFSANYTINGNSPLHWNAAIQASIVQAGSPTITLSGTPAFTTFASCDTLSVVRVNAITFSGSATGTRYAAATNSVIFTNGGGATYLPGNAAGSTATGGQYT